MLSFQEIWSPCRLLGETLAMTFQDLSLPRALQNTSALPERAASSQVTHPGSPSSAIALPVSLNASKEQGLLFIPPCIPGKAISAGYSVLLEGSVHFMHVSTDCVWNCTYWRANIWTWLEELGYVSPGSSTARAQGPGLFITHSKDYNTVIPQRNPNTPASSDCVCKGSFRKVGGEKKKGNPPQYYNTGDIKII